MKTYYDELTLKHMDIEDFLQDILLIDPRINPQSIEGDECPYTCADDFRQGSCQLFAYVLFSFNKEYDVRKIIADSKQDHHVFCIYDGKYIDVRGATTDFSLFSSGLTGQYSCDRSEQYTLEGTDFGEWADLGISFAKALIKRNPGMYLLENETISL